MLLVYLPAVFAAAQNPPETGDPYGSRGHPKSPDGKYEWAIRTNHPIRYELIDTSKRKTLATVKSYYPDVDSANIQYAKAAKARA
jgi:hypothetical protein